MTTFLLVYIAVMVTVVAVAVLGLAAILIENDDKWG